MREVFKDNLKKMLMYRGITAEIELPDLTLDGTHYRISAYLSNARIKTNPEEKSFEGELNVEIDLEEGKLRLEWYCPFHLMDKLNWIETDLSREEEKLESINKERLEMLDKVFQLVLYNMACQFLEQLTWYMLNVDPPNYLKLRILTTLLLKNPRLVLPPAEPNVDVFVSRNNEGSYDLVMTLYLIGFSLENYPHISKASITVVNEVKSGRESFNIYPVEFTYNKNELSEKEFEEYKDRFLGTIVNPMKELFKELDPLAFAIELK